MPGPRSSCGVDSGYGTSGSLRESTKSPAREQAGKSPSPSRTGATSSASTSRQHRVPGARLAEP
eukprot:10865868-Alexandrium_andersonii.AAC.1